ncbi:MAG: hypothetical protein H0T17_02890, partial [Propionibacteriales bacterium]|nr:hypothetical protein [Propionibacteriales bacterium]
VTVTPDGLVYIGGHFAQFVGTTGNPTLLAAVDAATGAVDPNFAPRLYTSYPAGVWALATSATMLYAGGDFTGVSSGGVNNHVPYFAAFSG